MEYFTYVNQILHAKKKKTNAYMYIDKPEENISGRRGINGFIL